MNKLNVQLLQLFCFALPNLVAMPVFAQVPDMLGSLEQQARSEEARGDYTSAGRSYLSMINSTSFGGMVPRSFQTAGSQGNNLNPEQKRIIARRALACLTRGTRDYLSAHPGDFRHCTAYLSLHEAYNNMQEFEPNNPSWLYLHAVYYCVKDKYVDADHLLRNAIAKPGGQESVKQKCRTLLAEIQPIVAQRMKFDKKLGRAMMYMHTSSTPSSDHSPSDYEMSASENARRAGNFDAADRLRRGGGSTEDWRSFGGP